MFCYLKVLKAFVYSEIPSNLDIRRFHTIKRDLIIQNVPKPEITIIDSHNCTLLVDTMKVASIIRLGLIFSILYVITDIPI